MKLRSWVITAGVAAAAGAVAGRQFRNWGATAAEQDAVFPGDSLISEPADQITRAVGIDAPADRVWPWLVQIGQDRAGMYSYDVLENLLGLGIHSADEIKPEWQDLAVGDRVVLVPSGWLGIKTGYSMPVAMIEPGRVIVLRQSPPEHPWNAVWSFIVESSGPNQCRLISRSRSERTPGLAGWAAAFSAELMDPITLLMTRRMLLGIKQRAEHLADD